MKKAKYFLGFLLGIMIIYFSYRDYTLANSMWKYCGGDHLGVDVLKFDSNFPNVFNDNHSSNGVAKIKLIDFKIRWTDSVIIVENHDGSLKGRYCSK